MSDAPHRTPATTTPYGAFPRCFQASAPLRNRRAGGGPCRRTLLGVLLMALVSSFEASAARADQLRVLAFGDSLTAGAGVAAADSLPAQLKNRLLADGYDVEVVSAGVSGDTTTTGLARLDYTLSAGPVDLVLLELGANDMLLGVDPKIPRANLDQIIQTFQARGVKVLLAAMASSANYGQAYKKEFDSIYPDLAKKHGVTMIPFILDGVWGNASLVIADGVHPNAAGVAKIVTKVAPYIEKSLTAMGAKRAVGAR